MGRNVLVAEASRLKEATQERAGKLSPGSALSRATDLDCATELHPSSSPIHTLVAARSSPKAQSTTAPK